MPAEQRLLNLNLPRRRALGRDDFLVSGSNDTALALVDSWRAWPQGQLALTGPSGAGKTHLAHVWMDMSGAERVQAARLSRDDVAPLTSIGAVVVEDIDRDLDAGAEAALFHLLNLMRSEQAPVLVTASIPPSALGLSLPDLKSRIMAMTHVGILEPDERLMRDLLVKQFTDRHLIVGDPVITFLLRRIERSAKAASDIVERLDHASRREAHSISIPFVKRQTGL